VCQCLLPFSLYSQFGMFSGAEAFDQNLRVDSNGEQSKWNKLDDGNSNINNDCFCEGAIMCGNPKFVSGCA
jgi:hypothetical protein